MTASRRRFMEVAFAMPVDFAVLASGSRGNSTLLRSVGYGLLIDLGIGPRTLGRRLADADASLDEVTSVLLTHTHGDHVRDASLDCLAHRRIVLTCHEGHRTALRRHHGFRELERQRLVRTYDDRPFLTSAGARVEAIEMSHDGGPTFGFRLEWKERRRGRSVSIGFVSDTGVWSDRMADALSDCDLLSLEFNHDVQLQRDSRRSPALIARNLGQRGHLSNVQGAELLGAVLARSRPGSVRHVVLTHLSHECNRPEIAVNEARRVARRSGRRLAIHAACQDRVTPVLTVGPGRRPGPGPVPVLAAFPWEAA